MSKRFETNLEVVLLILDLLVTELALYLAQATRFTLPYGVQLTFKHLGIHPLVYVMVAIIWASNLNAFLYRPRRHRHLSEELYALILAAVKSTMLLGGG